MLRRVNIVMLVACSLVLMFGCRTDSQTIERMDRAESVMAEQPEEALQLIESINPEELRRKGDKARYSLLYSEAQYHNYIDSDRDTLILPAVEYYTASDHNHEAARALYQQALILRRQGIDHLAEAMVALLEAEKRLEGVDDVKLRGLVYRAKGDVYNDGCLFANAIESYTRAKECFDGIGLEYHSAYALYLMGAMQMQLRDYDRAKELLNEALDYGVRVDNKRFMCGVLHEMIDLAVYVEDYALCGELLEKFDMYDCLLFGEAHCQAVRAILLSHRGDMRGALALIEEAKSAPGVERADLDFAQYVIYRNAGDTKQALYWEERSKHAQDRLMIEVLEQPVLNVQIEMLQNNLQAAERERRLVRQRNTIIYCVIILAVILVAYVIWRRIRRKNEDIAHYVETIHELSVALDNVPRELSASLGALYRDRFSELNELCDIYYDHSGSSRHKNMVFNKLTETIDSIKSDSVRLAELERAVDEYRGDLVSRLKALLPKLSERDYRVAVYSFAGFSNRAIAIFIDSDPVSVSKIKYNIKYKLKGVDTDDAKYVVAALSEK